jgi:4-hydroxy-3-methylbut-2-enyl diphosphate reductase
MLEASIKTLYTGEKVTGTVVNITPTEIQVELGTKHTGSIPLSEFSDDSSVKVEDVVKVGDEIEAQVMRVNDQDGIVTLSKKRLDANRNWEAVEEAKESGEILEGLIREENKGGVVANIKGVRVFIPASQTGLRRGEPMTGLVGTTVRMKIIEFNRQRRRVVGSIRAVTDAERKAKEQEVWANIEKGKKYEGVVKSLTAFGAFVDIGGVDGMVHITELSWSRLDKAADAVSVGDKVEVYVIDFDPDRKRIYEFPFKGVMFKIALIVPMLELIAAVIATVIPLSAEEVGDKVPMIIGLIFFLIVGEVFRIVSAKDRTEEYKGLTPELAAQRNAEEAAAEAAEA